MREDCGPPDQNQCGGVSPRTPESGFTAAEAHARHSEATDARGISRRAQHDRAAKDRIERMIKTTHYFSGLSIALFVGIHLLNHLMILRSEAAHIRFMQRFRKIYRHPVVESVLLTAVGVQICSGLYLVTQRWAGADGWFDWLHIGSGLYLALFLTNHVRAVMAGRHKMKLDTNLYYGAGVMNMWPQKLTYIPYYALAILSFSAHVACIHRIKAQRFVPAPVAEQHAVAILLLGCIATFLIIFKMSRLKMPAELMSSESAY